MSEEETDRIQSLYFEWEKRILWPKNNRESEAHDERCKETKRGQWCKCRTRQEEIHEWEDWAMNNMEKTIEELTWV